MARRLSKKAGFVGKSYAKPAGRMPQIRTSCDSSTGSECLPYDSDSPFAFTLLLPAVSTPPIVTNIFILTLIFESLLQLS